VRHIQNILVEIRSQVFQKRLCRGRRRYCRGNAIGVRLAEAGFSVAIIEAGIFYEIGKPVIGSTPAGAFFGIGNSFIDAVPTVDWQFQTEPQSGANNRQFHYARGKCLGGSSAINFMIHHRGNKGAYEQWADVVGDESYK
jgi:choline dehydrogenase